MGKQQYAKSIQQKVLQLLSQATLNIYNIKSINISYIIGNETGNGLRLTYEYTNYPKMLDIPDRCMLVYQILQIRKIKFQEDFKFLNQAYFMQI